MASLTDTLSTIQNNRRIAREILQTFEHPDLQRLSRLAGHATSAFGIALYNNGDEVLTAEVGFIETRPTMYFAALHLVLLTLQENDIDIEWDEVHMLSSMFRKADLARDIPTTRIAEYAAMGLQKSIEKIRSLPDDEMQAELHSVILGTTAHVSIPLFDEQLKLKPIVPQIREPDGM